MSVRGGGPTTLRVVEHLTQNINRRLNELKKAKLDDDHLYTDEIMIILAETFPEFVWTFHPESIHPLRVQRTY